MTKNVRSNPKPRIVSDTNVFISAIVFGGKPRILLDLLTKRTISLIIAEELLTELRRKFIAKFPDFLINLERVEKF